MDEVTAPSLQLRVEAEEAPVQVRGLWAGYESHVALEDVSFSLEKGSLVGLVGPNGSGKSTLLKVMLGLHRPWRGSVRLFGEDAGGGPAARGLRAAVGAGGLELSRDRGGRGGHGTHRAPARTGSRPGEPLAPARLGGPPYRGPVSGARTPRLPGEAAHRRALWRRAAAHAHRPRPGPRTGDPAPGRAHGRPGRRLPARRPRPLRGAARRGQDPFRGHPRPLLRGRLFQPWPSSSTGAWWPTGPLPRSSPTTISTPPTRPT